MEAILEETLGFHPTPLSNKDVWESEDIVNVYSKAFYLWGPEETVLNDLRSKLPKMKMLDIGVGAGRTTHYFAHLTKEYVGIDYSEAMIKSCRERFQKYPKRIRFEVAYAKALKSFEDSYFDFVLFSFNGIDYMNHEDRLRALREIRRVTKNGGYFCFSTHNLNSAWKLCTFQSSINPRQLLKESRRLFLMRLFNKNAWKILRKRAEKQQYMTLNNGVHGFRLRTYYITPSEQIKQLTDSEFTGIKIYGLLDGREIKNPSVLQNTMEAWLYYLCNARKQVR